MIVCLWLSVDTYGCQWVNIEERNISLCKPLGKSGEKSKGFNVYTESNFFMPLLSILILNTYNAVSTAVLFWL